MTSSREPQELHAGSPHFACVRTITLISLNRAGKQPRRSVGLKFLPDGLARDHQALERFQRKARAASALNHPNICTIYEVDEFEDQLFVAMELLDGRTLQNRVTGKAVGIEELANGEQIPHARGNELFLAKRYGSCQSSA